MGRGERPVITSYSIHYTKLYDSSISYMIRELKKKYDVPESFTDDSRFFNRFMNMCSLDIVEVKEPNDEELLRLVEFLEQVKVWTENLLEIPS